MKLSGVGVFRVRLPYVVCFAIFFNLFALYGCIPKGRNCLDVHFCGNDGGNVEIIKW